VLVCAYHAFSLPFLRYLIPLYLFAVPFLFREPLHFRFSTRDAATGIAVSAGVLLPFWFFFSYPGRPLALLPAGAVVFQLLGVAVPEEVYFRGFLQQRLGNTLKDVLLVSLLFSFMHLPQFIFYGDKYSLLTFFPSLVMGLLYWRTSNVLPSTIFHFLSNIVFLGVYDIL
jgi:membrane protease YdiL (CAAX protease family)